MSSDAIRFLYLPDSHGTYEDKEAVSCALRFGRHHRPDVVILGGDHVDFYQLSSFDKNPERLQGLQDDIDAGAAFVRQVRHSFKDARIFYLQGNHEDRLRRFIWAKAPVLKSLKSFSLPVLLGLGDQGVKYVESGVLQIKKILFKHGNAVRKRSGETARAEYEREGTSGCSGHTHRVGEFRTTNRSGTYKWVESGCLCQLTPEYMPGQIPDWAHAVSYGSFEAGGNLFSLSTADIIKGRTLYGGKVVTA